MHSFKRGDVFLLLSKPCVASEELRGQSAQAQENPAAASRRHVSLGRRKIQPEAPEQKKGLRNAVVSSLQVFADASP